MNATGVPVTLSYIDPNNNTYTIGSTTSDINGHYSYAFTPDVSGSYTVIATFGGSNSYFASSGETSMLYAQPASATSTPGPTPPQSAADMYFVPAVAGIIVAIVIVGAILVLLLLRKRP
jgi:hypothetical protein